MPAAILLVEDEFYSRKILAQFLRIEGYEVADAEDGTSAVKLIGSSTFDAVITDLDLGSGINGFDVLSCFEEHFPGKAKILVSGTFTDVTARCNAIGAVFINKPLELDGLIVKLENLLVSRPEDSRLASTMVVIDIHYTWRVDVRRRSVELRQRSEHLQRRIQENWARYSTAQEKLRRLLRR